ncbi:Pisatin demethylase protein [Rutstroemia sp. NJR-2017a BBW]|nr:Pisatin demethylase protein [Rutstroemia sp. NJR-2017a BBW]
MAIPAKISGSSTWMPSLIESRIQMTRKIYSMLYFTSTEIHRINLTLGNVAAHDVVAITLRTIFYYLAKSPTVYSKLHNEILEAEHEGLLSDPTTYTEVSSLRYLSAVVNESLRIHAGVGKIMERIVPKGGVELHGKKIPAGTIIGVSAWAMNHDRDIFGDDVEYFRPERWIENTQRSYKKCAKICLR